MLLFDVGLGWVRFANVSRGLDWVRSINWLGWVGLGWVIENGPMAMSVLASPGYAPGTIAVNVTWMKRRFNACLSNASQHVPIYLQPFPSNSTRKFKSSPF